MKPGVDLARTGALPQAVEVSIKVSAASGDVASPVITSTRAISGAGLKKCMPTSRSGRASAPPIAVIESEEVLLARMASSATMPSSFLNRSCLTARSSTMASITSLAGASSSSVSQAVMRPRIASRSAPVILPLSIERPRNFSMPAMPRATAPSKLSNSSTG